MIIGDVYKVNLRISAEGLCLETGTIVTYVGYGGTNDDNHRILFLTEAGIRVSLWNTSSLKKSEIWLERIME